MATPQIRSPRPYSQGEDFQLWLRRFEAYARAVKTPEEQFCNALLALLDDAAFRAYDLLALTDEQSQDYKQLVEALTKRFSPSTGQQELRWMLSQRTQEAEESLDTFADALVHLANKAYPTQDASLRAELVLDRFIAGLRDDRLHEALVQSPPETLKTLDEARTAAKRLEAAQSARRRMRSKRTVVCTTTVDSAEREDDVVSTSTTPQTQVATLGTPRGDPQLAEALRRNTELLERLLARMNTDTSKPTRPQRRRPPGSCWECGEQGHYRYDCPRRAGNDQRPATWVDRRPRTR